MIKEWFQGILERNLEKKKRNLIKLQWQKAELESLVRDLKRRKQAQEQAQE